MSILIYGIKNCDTMKKAMRWLETHQYTYTFHDYRKDGLSKELLEPFVAQLGWEALINKRGTTYRNLTDAQKNTLDANNALALMLEFPALIKRPLLSYQEQAHLGFKPEQYQDIFQTS